MRSTLKTASEAVNARPLTGGTGCHFAAGSSLAISVVSPFHSQSVTRSPTARNVSGSGTNRLLPTRPQWSCVWIGEVARCGSHDVRAKKKTVTISPPYFAASGSGVGVGVGVGVGGGVERVAGGRGVAVGVAAPAAAVAAGAAVGAVVAAAGACVAAGGAGSSSSSSQPMSAAATRPVAPKALARSSARRLKIPRPSIKLSGIEPPSEPCDLAEFLPQRPRTARLRTRT